MSDTVIRVENLGKNIPWAQQSGEHYTALRDVIANRAKGLANQFRTSSRALDCLKKEDFWH